MFYLILRLSTLCDALEPRASYNDVLPDSEIEYLVRRFRAARIIQRVFRLAIVNPEYKICRSRLHREFQGLDK